MIEGTPGHRACVRRLIEDSTRFAGVLTADVRAACILIAFTFINPVHAGDVEDIQATAREWVETIARRDPDAMVRLYDEEAVLLGTTSPILRQGPEAIRAYFAQAAQAPGLRMSFQGPMNIAVHGDIALNSGLYSVTLQDNGAERTIPLRYSFVYRRENGAWKIISHHSSAVPVPPAQQPGEK